MDDETTPAPETTLDRETTAPETPSFTEGSAPDDPLRALFHRWFVEYNPLYLASATLVLGGLWLIARESSGDGSPAGIASVAAVTELYALAVIAAAAWLVRIGMRRAGAMLGLIAVLYHGDLMLRLEAAPFVEGGRWLSLAWALLFAIKLVALARALELRLSRSALIVPSIGAAALAAMPHLLREVEDRTTPVVLAAFAVGALALWTSREVTSAVGFDVRGVRAIRGTWLTWAALALAHVIYWRVAFHVQLLALIPVAILLATRFAERELHLWALVAAALVLAPIAGGWLVPAIAAVVLVLRILRTPIVELPPPPALEPPYRGGGVLRPAALPVVRFVRAEPAAALRLASGALACTHLAARGALAGLAPDHLLAFDLVLDAALVASCTVLARRRRAYVPLAPAAAASAHLAYSLGLAPSSLVEWGWATVAAGFVTLALATRLSRLRVAEARG